MDDSPVTACENWKMEDWFVSSPNNFFHIRELIFMIKTDDTHITLAFMGVQIHLDIRGTKEQADELFRWFQDIKKIYHKALFDHQERTVALTRASVEIQNRMAGKIINHDH